MFGSAIGLLRISMLSMLFGVLLSPPVRAGLREGVDAWNRHDYAAALKEFLPLADQGNAEAQAYVGAAYLRGQGGLADPVRAIDYLRRSAEQGNAAGESELASAYLVGRGVPRDNAEAAKWFRRAAEQDDPSAETAYAQLLLNGVGVPKDAAEGLNWLKKAATQGNASAEFFLGRTYFNGDDVPKDAAEGVRWLERSAAHNNADAQELLGLAYYAGTGAEQNYQRAIEWFRKAAEAGRARSQFMLGTLYLQGLGMPKDYEIGFFWLSLAAASYPEGADRNNSLKAREFAAARLNAVQLAHVQKLIADWRSGASQVSGQTAKTTQSSDPSSSPGKPRTLDDFAHQSTGTGFIVNTSGDVLTNNHVIASCDGVQIRAGDGQSRPAAIVVRDERADLALLHASLGNASIVTFREGANIRAGDEVVALGYPLPGMLASQVNVTTGDVSSLAGIGNDPRFLQISAPVQPGNSGGPIFDLSGNLVGVVTAKLNALALANRTGDIAQNVNFALKANVARDFLDANHVVYSTASSERDFKAADVGERNQRSVVLIECLRQGK
ncbi:MAG TPA: tetratricopeptide repeat-containing serine protease family protein [Alphaproteobacteria bacterium]|nr:tetratricopeptide repeat-containing serine protease family protein [Alphaproteobacteria bacterium]